MRRAEDLNLALVARKWAGKVVDTLFSPHCAACGRGETIRASSMEPEEVEEGMQVSSEVVSVKRFPMTPMLADDAIHQMELLGHDFFLFYNSATKEFNLVYRRRNVGYSIIEPELL